MQSLFDGTSGSPAPPEVAMAMFCFHFHTSPKRVREEWSGYEYRVAVDFLQLKFEKEQDDVDRARDQQRRNR